MIKTFTLSAFLVILLTIGHPTSTAAQSKGSPPQAIPVIAAIAQQKPFIDKVEALGTLRANESVELTSTVSEVVIKINFQDNQQVTKGDILVELDSAEEHAELEEQKSFLAEARRQVNRLKPLVKKGAASESVLDESRSDALAASSRIDAIQSRIDMRVIKAPYDGILGLRNISVGALIQPGDLITTIDDTSIMKLDFAVPEVYLSALSTGVKITASSEAYPEKAFHGSISGVDSRIDPITRSIKARAVINNPEGLLKPGLLMNVEVQKNPRQAIIVPEETLVTIGSDNFLYEVIEIDGKTIAEQRKIQIGKRQFGEVEVLSGIEKGAMVVTHGTLKLRPGASVKVTATEEDSEPLENLLNKNENSSKDAAP